MKKTTTLLGITLLATLPLDALAASPSWTYVEGGYTRLDADNSGFDPDGLVISGTHLVAKDIYITGDYRMTEEGRYDLNTLTLGGGYRLGINSTTDAYFGANFEELDMPGNTERGYSINAGLRTMLSPQLELTGELGYYDVTDGEATMKVAANYYFNRHWAVGASFEKIDELDVMALTARYRF